MLGRDDVVADSGRHCTMPSEQFQLMTCVLHVEVWLVFESANTISRKPLLHLECGWCLMYFIVRGQHDALLLVGLIAWQYAVFL
jgi:hypothetical protein